MNRMIHLFLLSLFLLPLALFPLSLHAQTIWEPETGVSIRPHLEPHPSIVLPGNNPGEGLVIWAHPNTTDWDFHAQLLDENAAPLWEDEGRPLITGSGHQYRAFGFETGDGWFLIWMNEDKPRHNYAEGPLYYQRFDENGTPLWSHPPDPATHGVPFHSDNRIVKNFDYLLSEDNLLYVVAADSEPIDYDYELRLYRLLFDTGERDPSWPEDGLLLTQYPETLYDYHGPLKLFPDGDGGVIVMWDNTHELLAKRVNANGVLVWDHPAVRDIYSVDEGGLISDGEGGVIVAWDRRRRYQDDWFLQAMVNRLYPDGSWAVAGPGVPIIPGFREHNKVVAAVPSDSNSFIVVLDQYVVRGNDNDVFVQRVTINGDDVAYAWDERVHIQDLGRYQDDFAISTDGFGGIAMLLHDNDYNTFYLHISSDGVLSSDYDPFSLIYYEDLMVGYTNQHVNVVGITYQGPYLETRYRLYDPVSGLMLTPDAGNTVVRGFIGTMSEYSDALLSLWNGEVRVSWDDVRYYQASLPFLQKITLDDGELLFQDNGICIIPGLEVDTNTLSLVDMVQKADHQGNLYYGIIARPDRETWPDYICQKLNANGNALWGDAGMLFGENVQVRPTTTGLRTALDEQGGLFAAFHYADYDLDYESIGMVYVAADGTSQWESAGYDFLRLEGIGEDPNPKGLRYDSEHQLLTLLYRENDELHAIGMNISGEILWDTLIEPDMYPHYFEIHTSSWSGFSFIIWYDHELNIRAQLLGHQGIKQWEEDGRVLHTTENSDIREFHASTLDTGSPSFWIGFSDDDARQYMVQRFDSEGSPIFDPPLYFQNANDGLIQTFPDGSANVALRMRYEILGVFCAHVGPNGEYDGNILRLGSGVNHFIPALYDHIWDGEDGSIVLWAENRLYEGWDTPGSLFTQRISFPNTGIDEHETNALPDEFSIDPIYPNPFNATATTLLSLPAPGELNVALFNVLGQEVMTVAHGPHIAGTHTLTVDASTLASGIYFVRAEMPDVGHIATRKIVLMK